MDSPNGGCPIEKTKRHLKLTKVSFKLLLPSGVIKRGLLESTPFSSMVLHGSPIQTPNETLETWKICGQHHSFSILAYPGGTLFGIGGSRISQPSSTHLKHQSPGPCSGRKHHEPHQRGTAQCPWEKQ